MGTTVNCQRCGKRLIPLQGNEHANCECDDPLIMRDGQVEHARPRQHTGL